MKKMQRYRRRKPVGAERRRRRWKVAVRARKVRSERREITFPARRVLRADWKMPHRFVVLRGSLILAAPVVGRRLS
jgi:hypothetical protein